MIMPQSPALRRLRLLLVLYTICMLSACISPRAEMRYFLLTPLEEGSSPPGEGMAEQYVLVGPLQLPGYLDRPHLMTRLPDGQLGMSELDRWAEPLDAVLARTLAENLARLSGSQRVLTYPAGRVAIDRAVTGRVIRFDTDAGGEALLRIQWSVRDGRGQMLSPVRIGEYRARAASDSAAARVAALSDVLAKFSVEVAAELAATGSR
jgi:uncharacterized protein